MQERRDDFQDVFDAMYHEAAERDSLEEVAERAHQHQLADLTVAILQQRQHMTEEVVFVIGARRLCSTVSTLNDVGSTRVVKQPSTILADIEGWTTAMRTRLSTGGRNFAGQSSRRCRSSK